MDVNTPDVRDVARWLIGRFDVHLFPADHPGTERCSGWHHPDRPCDGGRGKHPACKWSRDASNDPEVVDRMLARGLRNLAVACKPSRLLVVDEDRPGAFEQYAAEIGQVIEPTFTVLTAKGRHRYYWQPGDGEPLGNGVGALASRGIDIRGAKGNGGYVIGPGSVHATGVLYLPEDSAAPILPAPGWLVAALQAVPKPDPVPRRAARTVRASGGRPFRVLTGLVQTVLDATPGVDRNQRLYWAACRAFEHAHGGLFAAEEARAALLDAARHVGLADGESEATLDSALTMTGARP